MYICFHTYFMYTWFYAYILFIGVYNILCAYIILLSVIFTFFIRKLFERYSRILYTYGLWACAYSYGFCTCFYTYPKATAISLPEHQTFTYRRIHGYWPFLILVWSSESAHIFLSDVYINVHLGNMSVESWLLSIVSF